jgi:hypothetical protein
MLDATAFMLVPASETAVKLEPFDSITTSELVLTFVVPAEPTRSPMIDTAPVAEPTLRAPIFEVFPEVEVTTPSVPPSIVMVPVLARTSKPNI